MVKQLILICKKMIMANYALNVTDMHLTLNFINIVLLLPITSDLPE